MYNNIKMFDGKESGEQIRQDLDKTISRYIIALDNNSIDDADQNELHMYENFPEIKLYLDNDYSKLNEKKYEEEDIEKILYYNYVFRKKDNCILDNTKGKESDLIKLILSKIRRYYALINSSNFQYEERRQIIRIFDTIPENYSTITNRLRDIIFSSPEDHNHMMQILNKQKKRYSNDNNNIYWDDVDTNISELRLYAYDYYFFQKCNYIPIDYFVETRTYFVYYLEAILCTYSPDVGNNNYHGLETIKEPYVMNEIDFDLFVKYIGYEKLKTLIGQYYVDKILLETDICILNKFKKLCNSIYEFKFYDLIRFLKNFCLLIPLINITEEDEYEILSLIFMLIKNMSNSEYYEELLKCMDDLYLRIDVTTKSKLNCDVIDFMVNNYFDFRDESKPYVDSIIRILKNDEKIKEMCDFRNIEACIDNEADIKKRLSFISLVGDFFNCTKYKEFISNNIDKANSREVFDIVYKKIIPCDDLVINYYKNQIKNTIRNQGDSLTISTELKRSINYIVLLHLLEFNFNIKEFEEFAGYSDILEFIFNPKTFDYRKVNTRDNSWINLIYNEGYQNYFIDNRKAILNNQIKKDIKNNVASNEQYKIVYGILCEKKDINYKDFPEFK